MRTDAVEEIPFQGQEANFPGTVQPVLLRLHKVLVAICFAVSLLVVTFLVRSSLSSIHAGSAAVLTSESPQEAFEATSTSENRWVEQPVATMPGVEKAQLNVRMLGVDVNGTHIVGHLVTLANPLGRVSLALPPSGCGTRELTTVTAKAHRPACRLAINAGYFNVDNGACIGNVVSHGQVVQTVPLSQSNVNFGIKDGKFFIGYLSPDEIDGFEHLVSGVVWLVRDGKNYVKQGWKEANITVQTSGAKYATNLASRTAVGFDAAGRLIIVQIDGSIAVGHNKRGMDMNMLADALIKHGAVNAINLDGGGSSAMAHNGILINYPSDNRPPSCDASGLYQCERKVSTILCIHEQGSHLMTSSDAVTSNGSEISSSLTLAIGGCTIFAVGAIFALVVPHLIFLTSEKDLERQLSTDSTRSARDVRSMNA